MLHVYQDQEVIGHEASSQPPTCRVPRTHACTPPKTNGLLKPKGPERSLSVRVYCPLPRPALTGRAGASTRWRCCWPAGISAWARRATGCSRAGAAPSGLRKRRRACAGRAASPADRSGPLGSMRRRANGTAAMLHVRGGGPGARRCTRSGRLQCVGRARRCWRQGSAQQRRCCTRGAARAATCQRLQRMRRAHHPHAALLSAGAVPPQGPDVPANQRGTAPHSTAAVSPPRSSAHAHSSSSGAVGAPLLRAQCSVLSAAPCSAPQPAGFASSQST